MKNILFGTLLTALLAACSSTPMKADAPGAAAPASATTASTAPSTATVSTPSATLDPLKDPQSVLAQRNVYFDFDQYLVDEKYRSMVQAHAAYLQSHPNAQLTLIGNTDARGSREYNLALGQKRAEAVRKMLTLMGAADKQIEAISFGMEKPKAAGQNEAAWAQNRRADLQYRGQ